MGMRVFLYEFITGGGMWAVAGAGAPAGGLLAEGSAMAGSLAADLLRIDGCHVEMLLDSRLPESVLGPIAGRVNWRRVSNADEERRWIQRLAGDCDATILIAPEFDRLLLDRCEQVEACGGRLASPDSRFVALASDKQATCEWLRRAKVNSPMGTTIAPGGDWPSELSPPAVLKPIDGAGSLDTRLLRSRDELHAIERTGPMRLEAFHPGRAASVAVLCGPHGFRLLEPCYQRLSDDGRFRYLGGAAPLDMMPRHRAQALAARAIAALPTTIGYVGVDMVLGSRGDGSEDYVIEVNPRLTTSYVGLSRLCRANLAAAMLAIVGGGDAELSFGSDAIEFGPFDGEATAS
ncbi:MAG: ATP-grasp domain-containing protein [Planctomycetales bacterium]|nr:ATP-grasp domain-containing protein [Planctomycetales bacterium]